MKPQSRILIIIGTVLLVTGAGVFLASRFAENPTQPDGSTSTVGGPVAAPTAKAPPSSPETSPAAVVTSRTNGTPSNLLGTTNLPITSAASKPARPNPAMRSLEIMKESLSLTDDQARDLERVFKEQQARISALRTNTGGSRQERKAALADLRKTSDAKIASHLTPAQREKLQQMRQAWTQSPNSQPELGHAATPSASYDATPRAVRLQNLASQPTVTNPPTAVPFQR